MMILRAAPRIARFAVKHAVAAIVVGGGVTALILVTYIVLFLVAIVTDQRFVALPLWLLIGVAASAGAVLLVFFPATVIAEWVCRKRTWPRLTQIPVVTLLGAIIVLTEVMAVTARQPDWQRHRVRAALIAFAALLIPLGAYWLAMQTADALLGAVARMWEAFWPSDRPISRTAVRMD